MIRLRELKIKVAMYIASAMTAKRYRYAAICVFSEKFSCSYNRVAV
jgi:hypothetical protein